MTNLLYKVDKWGGCTFDIMTTGIHELHKWIWEENEWVLTVEPVEDMVKDLNHICRGLSMYGNGWAFEGCPDFGHDWWRGAEAAKQGELVKVRFEFLEPKLVSLFKLMWHGR